VTYSGVGDVLKAQGKPREALKSYQASTAIMDRLATLDPRNRGLQRDLSVTYVRLADFYRDSGRSAKARKAFAAASAIMTRLAGQIPQPAKSRRSLVKRAAAAPVPVAGTPTPIHGPASGAPTASSHPAPPLPELAQVM